MTPEQSRAARAWLAWSQLELARQANVSLRTIQAFEKGGRVPMANNIVAIRLALEKAGIRLLFDRDGSAIGIVRQGVGLDPSDVVTEAPAEWTCFGEVESSR
jgi:DNA-binding XRE family transcriptional regulator